MTTATKGPTKIDPGITIDPTTPEAGTPCRYQVAQKIAGRWTHAACGEPATSEFRLWDHTGDTRTDAPGYVTTTPLPLCHACAVRLTHEFVTLIS